MNIFKINSQGLMKSETTEDLFSRSILDEERVFDLQRFDNKVKFTSQNSGFKMEAANSLTGVLSAFTLGRVGGDQSNTLTGLAFGTPTGTSVSSGIQLGHASSQIWVAPLFGATNSEAATSTSYQLTAYSATGKLRLAVAYKDLATSNSQVGIAASTSFITPSEGNKWITFGTSNTAAADIPAGWSYNLSNTSVWSTTFTTGTYKAYSRIVGGGTSQTDDSIATIGGSSTSIDFYDVNLKGHSYTYVGDSTKSLDFVSSQTAEFGSLTKGTALNLKLNRTAVTVKAQRENASSSSLFTLNKVATGTDAIQSFTGITATPDIWVSFSVDAGSSVLLGGSGFGSGVYTNEASNGGTITFGATDVNKTNTNFIEFAGGKFMPGNIASGTVYALTDKASGTFAMPAGGTYYFDFDGIGNGAAPIAFSTTKASSITAVANSTNISLAGGLKALTTDASAISAYTYTLSDTAAATLAKFTFTDFTNGSDAVVSFTSGNLTDIHLTGAFESVMSDTANTNLNNVHFTLNDNGTQTTQAVLGAIGVTDAKDSKASYVNFGKTSETVTLGGVLAIGSQTGIIFTMSDNAVVTAGPITFSDTADGGATFKFGKESSDITLSGILTVTSGTSMTDVLTGYAFTLSDTAFAQLGLVAVSDTTNASDTKIIFGAAESISDVTLSGGGADIVFGKVAESDVYTNYTYTLSDTGAYSINGTKFTVNANGASDANKVSFTGGNLTYTAAHTDTKFAVIDTDTVTGVKVGSNITAGSETIKKGSAKLFGNIYVGATDADVSYEPVVGSDVALITGNGFQISGVSGTTLIGVDSYTFKTGSTGVFYMKDGGSDLTITNAAGENVLTFNEVSDSYVTKLELTGAQALSITGDLVLKAGSDVQMTYTLLEGVNPSDTSSIAINGLKFEGSDATVTRTSGNQTYTVATTDTALSITAEKTDAVAKRIVWAAKSTGELELGGITFTTTSDVTTGNSSKINIDIGSEVTAITSDAAIQKFDISRGSNAANTIEIADGTGSDAYTVLVDKNGDVKQITNIDGGAVLTKVGGATAVKVKTDGIFTFKTSRLIGESGTDAQKIQTFQLSNLGPDSDVTFVLSSDTSTLGGTVIKIEGLGTGASVAVTDTTVNYNGGTIAEKTNYWTKTVNQYIERNNDKGIWGAESYMAYIANQTGDGAYSLYGVTSTTDVAGATQEQAEFESSTITSEATMLKITGTDASTVPLTFQNSGGIAAYGAMVSDGTVTVSLFTALGKTSGNVGVQAVADESGKYSLTLVGVSETGIPASFTSKAALASGGITGFGNNVGIQLSDTAALTVYDGFTVSGTGVAVAANSETVTVTAGASDAYVSMSSTSDTIVFGESDNYKTFQLHENGTLKKSLAVKTNGESGSARGTNTAVFAVSVSGGAGIADTISGTSDNGLTVNGITYSATEGAVTYSVDSPDGSTGKDTLSITGGMLTATSTATGTAFITDTTISFGNTSGIGLVVGDVTYQTMSDAKEAVSFNIASTSDTQLATISEGSGQVQETVKEGAAFFFNDNLYTATSTVASILLELGKDDKFLADTSATGKTTAEQSYTVAALSDTYTMASGAGVTLVYDATVTDTYANTTFTSGSGTMKVSTNGTFHISNDYLSTTATGSTTYVYTSAKGGTLTLNVAAAGSETITLGAVSATRADSETTTFSFAPYEDKLYEYTAQKTGTDTLTFALNSETAKTYGAAGILTAGKGTRLLGADDVTAASGTTLSYMGNEYSPAESATMMISISDSKATETFVAGSGTFTAKTGETFYYDILDAEGNVVLGGKADGIAETFTAKTDVTLGAYFTADSTDASIISAAGTAEMTGSGTHVIAALSETYTIESGLMTLNLDSGLGSETLTFTSGSGTTAELATFAISQNYMNGVKEDGDAGEIYNYDGKATLKMTLSSGTTTVEIASGSGTRLQESATGVEFAYTLDESSHTYVSTAAELTYKIDSGTAKAEGNIFAGEGTRAFVAGSETSTLGSIEYNSDTYTVDGGTVQLTLKDGAGSETLISANATFTMSNTGVFHYEYEGNLNSYTATSDVTFKLSQSEESGTNLTSASGKGVRNLADGQSATYVYLGSNTYTFENGATVQLEITNVDSATELAYAGIGTYKPATGDTAVAQFNESGSATGTAYSYTSFADATFQITMESGTVTGQTLTAGSATRVSATGEDFTYEGKSYTAKGRTAEASSMTFVLDATRAKENGAAGGIFSGVGYIESTETQSYTVSETQNAYTAVTGAEMKLTLTDGTGSETMFNATAEQGFDKFNYKGTAYKSSGTAVVGLKLELVDGVASETGISGTGIFEATAGTETFTYESNEYTATSGTQLSITFDGKADTTPEFVSGRGNRTLANGDEFTYTDKNVYAVEGTGQLSVSKEGDAESVTTLFSSGTGNLDASKTNNQFNFTSPTDSQTYLYNNTGDAQVEITGASDPSAVKIALTGGTAERTASSTGLTFTFDSNTYTATGEITFTLSSESGTAVENATGGKGTRTASDTFMYTSPTDGKDYQYTANNVVLSVELSGQNDGNGTETLVNGAGTRNLESGTLFAYAAKDLGGETATYTTLDNTTIYELTLTDTTQSSSSNILSLMDHNVSVVTETLKQAAGTTTVKNPTYTSLRTNESATYTGDVTFKLDIADGAESVTWVAGSATMQVAAGNIFKYQLEGADVTTYTVKSDATFKRTSQTEEVLTEGSGQRAAKSGENFTAAYLSDTYSADSGSTIVLSAQDNGSGTKVVGEAFDSGTATYAAKDGDTFHYVVGGGTREYTANAPTTLQVGVSGGSATSVISAEGAGTRGFAEGETTTYVVLSDTYQVESGTFTLTLDSATYAAPSETLTQGSGVYNASVGAQFHVSDKVFGWSEDSATYTYNALSETKLNLTITDGENTVTFESGFGTRPDGADTFTFKGNAYTKSEGDLVYSIGNDATIASGELYTAVGTRDAGAETTGETIFNADTYTVDKGTLTLKVVEGESTETMTSGTATYVADTNKAFHFGAKEYTAIETTTLKIAVESTTNLISIDGVGTRAAEGADLSNTALTHVYQQDTYSVTSGTFIQFTATGEPTSASETVFGEAGIVAMDVAASGTFHTNSTGEWYEYTAGSNTTIALTLGENVQTFDADPNATRTASDTSFSINSETYAAEGQVTYMLTGTGKASELDENLYTATGSRTDVAGESYTSLLNNVYTLTSGTYTINVAEGAGTETLTSGAGTATYESGEFNYGSASTTYKAQNATLTLTKASATEETETLTSGAGYDSVNGNYILATNSTLDASAVSGTAVVSVSGAEGVVTIGADTTAGLTSLSSGELNADLASGKTLKVNGKTYSSTENGAVVFKNTALNEVTASGVAKAEGDFTSDSPTLAGGKIGVENDTDVAVTFAETITKLDKLSSGVTVSEAAGATKAITDTEGEFNFSKNNQAFKVTNDAAITFQLDSDGLVTGIAGIDAENAGGEVTIAIQDGNWSSEIKVTELGKVLNRNEDGSWADGDVDAVAYGISVDSDGSVFVSAVDAQGDDTRIKTDSIATVATDTGKVTISLNDEAVGGKPVMLVNASTNYTVDLPGHVTGVGQMVGGNVAIQLDSSTTTEGAFKTGTLSGTKFTSNGEQTITGAIFDVTPTGAIIVNSQGDAKVAISDTSRVSLLADTNTDKFTINDGPEMTLTIDKSDSDGKGLYTLQGSASITGLAPIGVDSGTVVIPTDEAGTTFAINGDSVTVTNDNDGMTLEIYTDTLVGVSDISTAATVTASSDVSTLNVNGDVVAVTSDPIKYNATNEKWLAGPAPAAEGVIGYLIEVTAGGTVALSYQTSDTIKATTNVADYSKVFADNSYAPDEDGGTLKPYTGGVIALNTLGSDVSVSVAAANGAVAVNLAEYKDVVLKTANATYTINDQQIIPNAELTVFAQSDTVQATVNAATTIQHNEMTFDATTDSAVVFTPETIYLNNTAHVANTNSDQVFNVNGKVGFDSAILVAGVTSDGTTVSNVRTTSSSVSSGMSVNGNELNIAGNDLAYTLDVAGSDTLISGISAPATVSGALAENAQILTESTGAYQINETPFTIGGDSAVAFKTTNGAVTAIDSLAGTATGNFAGISVDGKTVYIYNDIDSVQAVTADGENVTEITGVGNANEDVVVANAGGATLISTNANGGIYFGAPSSTINSQHYTVADEDSVVSFLTSGLDDFTPSVSGVQGLENGTIAISQADTNLAINSETVSLTDVGSDVTLNVANSAIVSVNGLTGGISGIESGVAVEITDVSATVNGARIAIYEPNGTNVIYTSTVSDTVTTNVITGLNKDAAVYAAANMNILTEEAGEFTFNNGVYTISGDDSVTFETDGNSRVKNVANVVGTVQSSASNNTINGAAVSSNDTDVTIVASEGGVSAVLGAKDGDSISVPDGTAVEVAGSSDPKITSTFAVNGKEFAVTGDTDTVVYTPGSTDSISGLAPGASLRAVNTAGLYNVNGSDVYATVGAVIIGDEEGTAHVYDPSDVDITADDDPETVVEKVTGGTSTQDKYVDKLDSETAQAALAAGGTALDGNLEVSLGGGTGTSSTDSVETADFSNSKGIKKATMNGEGNQNVKFNDEGGNIAIVGDDAEGAKNVSLGGGGDLAVVGKTGATTPVNIKAGRGQDSVVSQGRNVAVDVSAGGPTKLMANGLGASMEVSGYDANTGAGIQTTNSDIKAAVKKNTIGLENGKVTTSDGAEIRTNAENPEGASIVNFYNLKGLMTKVGYTHNEGGTVDMSSSKNDVVMKGNYTEGNAQRKSGSSKLMSGSGDDYALGGAGDDIDVGAGNNTVELDPTTRTNADAGAVISQTATSGRTEVNGFHNDFGDTGDRVNVSTSARVRFANGALTFFFGAAQLILNNMTAWGSNSSADLAESADEDDNATAVNGSINYAPVMIGNASSAVKTAVASADNWIGGSDSLWTEDNMPQAYVGENSGINFTGSDGALDVTLGSGNEGNGAGTLGGQAISVRGISKVRLGSGSSTVYGAANTNNTIVTGLGDSSVWGGGASNDTFIGRQTSLKSGESTFFYVDGDGKDTISNFEFLTSGNENTADVVNVLGTSVTGASTSGNDVIINLARSDDDRLTIKDAVGKDFAMEYGNVGSFETLVAQVNNNALTYDSRATYYQATGRNATLNVDSGLDNAEIWLNNNRDFSTKTFVGDIQVLNASGVQGRSTLVGNGYNNSIVGSSENSSMWGGSSNEANDTLVGGAGADMFWYGKNEGNDVVTGADENDVINLYNVNIADVESYDNWNITNNSISFNLKDGGSLTIQSNNSGVGFKFADDGNTYAIDQRTKEYYTK